MPYFEYHNFTVTPGDILLVTAKVFFQDAIDVLVMTKDDGELFRAKEYEHHAPKCIDFCKLKPQSPSWSLELHKAEDICVVCAGFAGETEVKIESEQCDGPKPLT